MRTSRLKYDVVKIKEWINPHDFYLLEQNIDRLGYKSGDWALAGLCPFHDDSSAGSFKVNHKSGSYICFSCGAKGGDIIAFTEKKYAIPFLEALAKLADDWRVS
jgi:DNA primase